MISEKHITNLFNSKKKPLQLTVAMGLISNNYDAITIDQRYDLQSYNI